METETAEREFYAGASNIEMEMGSSEEQMSQEIDFQEDELDFDM